MTATVDNQCMRWELFQPLNSCFVTRESSSSIKSHSYKPSQLNVLFPCSIQLMQNRFFRGKISMKCSSGTPRSTQQQQIVSSTMVVTSVHSSAMMLKRVPYEVAWVMFQEHSQALLQSFLGVCCISSSSVKEGLKSLSPQLTTNSTSLSKLVVCAMCWWARKWVHRSIDLIAFLFCNLCCSPTLWSWLIMDPSFLALSASTSICQDRRCTSLFDVFSFSESPSSSEWFGNPSPTSPLKRSSTRFA